MNSFSREIENREAFGIFGMEAKEATNVVRKLIRMKKEFEEGLQEENVD